MKLFQEKPTFLCSLCKKQQSMLKEAFLPSLSLSSLHRPWKILVFHKIVRVHIKYKDTHVNIIPFFR
jgi:hypothetical protein